MATLIHYPNRTHHCWPTSTQSPLPALVAPARRNAVVEVPASWFLIPLLAPSLTATMALWNMDSFRAASAYFKDLPDAFKSSFGHKGIVWKMHVETVKGINKNFEFSKKSGSAVRGASCHVHFDSGFLVRISAQANPAFYLTAVSKTVPHLSWKERAGNCSSASPPLVT